MLLLLLLLFISHIPGHTMFQWISCCLHIHQPSGTHLGPAQCRLIAAAPSLCQSDVVSDEHIYLLLVSLSSSVLTTENTGSYYRGQVRLRGGDYPSEGRVEIYLNGRWGTVCTSAIACIAYKRQVGSYLLQSGSSVCRQLGYTNATAASSGTMYVEMCSNVPT